MDPDRRAVRADRVEQALQVIDKCVGRAGWDDVETAGEDLDAAESRHRIGEATAG